MLNDDIVSTDAILAQKMTQVLIKAFDKEHFTRFANPEAALQSQKAFLVDAWFRAYKPWARTQIQKVWQCYPELFASEIAQYVEKV